MQPLTLTHKRNLIELYKFDLVEMDEEHYQVVYWEPEHQRKFVLTLQHRLFWDFSWENLDDSLMHIHVCEAYSIDDKKFKDHVYFGYVENDKAYFLDYRKEPTDTAKEIFDRVFPEEYELMWNKPSINIGM